MNAWLRFRRRRWVRRYALTIFRHSGIGWAEALTMANAGRFAVELKSFEHSGLGQPKPYGKTLVTERGLLWLSVTLNMRLERQAANDD